MKCALCNLEGKYAVKFMAYSLGLAKLRRNRVTGDFNIKLCESHAKTTTKEDLLAKGGWEKIQQMLLSKRKPLLDSSTVELQMVLVAQ